MLRKTKLTTHALVILLFAITSASAGDHERDRPHRERLRERIREATTRNSREKPTRDRERPTREREHSGVRVRRVVEFEPLDVNTGEGGEAYKERIAIEHDGRRVEVPANPREWTQRDHHKLYRIVQDAELRRQLENRVRIGRSSRRPDVTKHPLGYGHTDHHGIHQPHEHSHDDRVEEILRKTEYKKREDLRYRRLWWRNYYRNLRRPMPRR